LQLLLAYGESREKENPMKRQNNRDQSNKGRRVFAMGGGLAGLVAFLAVGLLPALVYGGFAGVTLAAAILGHPIDGSGFAKAMVVGGMVLGLLCTASLFTLAGAAVGTGLFSLSQAVARRELSQANGENAAAAEGNGK